MVTVPQTVKEAPAEQNDESVRNIWLSYQSYASIHGVAQVGGPRLYSFRKWIWLFLVISMSIGLCVILIEQVQILCDLPMRTSFGGEFEAEVPFPAVTLCNLNQFRRSRVPDDAGLKVFIRQVSEYETLRNRNGSSAYSAPKTRGQRNATAAATTSSAGDRSSNSTAAPDTPADGNDDAPNSQTYTWSNITGPELSRIVWNAAQPLNSFLYLCSWDGQIIPCDDIFEARMTDLGVCFTFNGGGGNVSLGGAERLVTSSIGSWTGLRVLVFVQQEEYYYSKTMQSGMKVVLHEPLEEPLPSTSGISLRPGVSAYLGFTRQELQGLAAPYKAYGNAYCVDTQSEELKEPLLHRYKLYTEMACYRDCMLGYIVSLCNCTNPFEPEAGLPVCSVDEMIDCYIPARGMFTKKELRACECRPPCRRVMYDVKSSYADFASDFSEEQTKINRKLPDSESPFLSRNVIDVRVFLESMLVLRITQEPAMTFTDILGTLGGHLGLFLGASILSITELTEVVLLLVLRRLGYLGAVNTSTAENDTRSHDNDVAAEASATVELPSAPPSPTASSATMDSVDIARDKTAETFSPTTQNEREHAA